MDTLTSRDGTTIAYDRSAAGPAVILVGGALQHRAIDPRSARLAALLAPEPGQDILIAGSRQLVRTLMRHDLYQPAAREGER